MIETSEGLVFDVKGLVHPPNRVVAFVRYFPHAKGDRIKRGSAYGKVYSFSDRYALLKEKYPQYLIYDQVFDERICEVPLDCLKKRYDPIVKLQQLKKNKSVDTLESKTTRLATLVKERANIRWNAIGVSGSILAGLHRKDSDIDLIVYGSLNGRKVNIALKEVLTHPDSGLRPYDLDELKKLFDFRSKDTAMSFADFVRTESRKAFQGKFMDTDYFIRFVKDWNETEEKYGDNQYKNMACARIRATISDDSESLFTPCKYSLENTTIIQGLKSVKITEISSFRGRFCEQAKIGEEVTAQGKVEKVTDLRTNHAYFRLLIGNNPSDYMIPI